MSGPIEPDENQQIRSCAVVVLESPGDSTTTVGCPPTLPERVEMKSREEINPSAQPMATESYGSVDSRTGVGTQRSGEAGSEVHRSCARENSIDARLGVDFSSDCITVRRLRVT